VNAERRRLHMVKVEKDYGFEGPNGKPSLKDLFEGRRQLIVYHFIVRSGMGQGVLRLHGFRKRAGRSVATRQMRHEVRRGFSSSAGQAGCYKAQKGWTIAWFSSFGSDFNYDFHVTLDPKVAPVEYNYRNKEMARAKDRPVIMEGEEHGLSVFFRIDDDVFHTYSAYARGTESLTDAYRLLDTTPYGRQQDFEDSPAGWPQKPTYG